MFRKKPAVAVGISLILSLSTLNGATAAPMTHALAGSASPQGILQFEDVSVTDDDCLNADELADGSSDTGLLPDCEPSEGGDNTLGGGRDTDDNPDGTDNSGDVAESTDDDEEPEEPEEPIEYNDQDDDLLLGGANSGLTLEIEEIDLAAVATLGFSPAAGMDRWSGNDRYKTATSIADNANLKFATTAFIASGQNFPDALAAAAAAGLKQAPILLGGKTVEESQQAIDYLTGMPNLTKVWIVGGPSAISGAVHQEIVNRLQGRAVPASATRLQGAGRYETAVEIANEFFPKATEVFVASGLDAAGGVDALAAAAAAGITQSPIILTSDKAISDAARAYLTGLAGPVKVHIVGGTARIPDSVKNEIGAIVGAGNVDRIAGADRYLTAKEVADYKPGSPVRFFPNPTAVYIATGGGFADALAGAPVAAMSQAPILLTNSKFVPVQVRDFIATNGSVASAVVLGGPNAVSDDAYDVIGRLLARTNYTPVSGVALSSGFTLDKGKSQNLIATVSPSTATIKKLVWATSNDKVAKVNDAGQVTAVNGGKATISVTTVDGGYLAKTDVTVKNPLVCKDVELDTGGSINTCQIGEVTAKIEGNISLSGSGEGYQAKFMTNGSGLTSGLGAVSFGLQYDITAHGNPACSSRVCFLSENIKPSGPEYHSWGFAGGRHHIGLTLHDSADVIVFWVDGNPVGAAGGQKVSSAGFNFYGEVNTKKAGDRVSASITDMKRYEKNPRIWMSGCYSEEYLPGKPIFKDDGKGTLTITWNNFVGQTPAGMDWDSAVTANRAGWCGA